MDEAPKKRRKHTDGSENEEAGQIDRDMTLPSMGNQSILEDDAQAQASGLLDHIESLTRKKDNLSNECELKQAELAKIDKEIDAGRKRLYQAELIEALEEKLEKLNNAQDDLSRAQEHLAFWKQQYEYLELGVDDDDKDPIDDRAELKRCVDATLFYPNSNKRMRPISDMPLPTSRLTTKDFRAYLIVHHNETLRIAARGGLINPMDFGVGDDGQIGITQFGLKKAEAFERHIAQPQALAISKAQHAKRATDLVWDLFFEAGFFEQGHPSLCFLRDKLVDQTRVLNPGDLVEDISCIHEKTKERLERLKNIHGLVGEHSLEPTTRGREINLALIKALYSRYSDGELPAATRLATMSFEPGVYRQRCMKEMKWILERYQSLFDAREKIRALVQEVDLGNLTHE